jgi:hypothetical protein
MITIQLTSLPSQYFRGFNLVESLLSRLAQALRGALWSARANPDRRRRVAVRCPLSCPSTAYRSYGAWLDAYHRHREMVDAQAVEDHPDDWVSRMSQVKAAMGEWARRNAGSDTSGWTEQERAVHEITSNPSTWAH